MGNSANYSIVLIVIGLQLASLLLFLFLDFFASNEAIVMIFVIILDMNDFWYTKNIERRILVSLRLQNSYNPDTQQEIWNFESKKEIKEAKINRKTFLAFFMIYWDMVSFIFLRMCYT